jgi:hypothetical protein
MFDMNFQMNLHSSKVTLLEAQLHNTSPYMTLDLKLIYFKFNYSHMRSKYSSNFLNIPWNPVVLTFTLVVLMFYFNGITQSALAQLSTTAKLSIIIWANYLYI